MAKTKKTPISFDEPIQLEAASTQKRAAKEPLVSGLGDVVTLDPNRSIAEQMAAAVAGKKSLVTRHDSNPAMPGVYVTPKAPDSDADAPGLIERARRKRKKKRDINAIVDKVISVLGQNAVPVAKSAAVPKSTQPVLDFSVFGIPDLAATATRPRWRVEFDLGPMGKQEAWFHWLIEHDNCLFLVYDTRFEYGVRYSPPNSGADKPIRLRIPDHKKEYLVHSLGMQLPFGVFHITTLILSPEAQQNNNMPSFPGGPPSANYLLDLSTGPGEQYNFNSPTFFEEEQEYNDD